MVESAPSTREPTFTLLLSAKDVGCCLEMARELQVPMTVGSAVSQVFTRTVARGLGAEGPGATLLTIEEEAGVRIRKGSGVGRA
jgi:3-hydroxyisobutyrate dehydrogenase-like beta-hydroxyacid dehydrogenase